MSCRHSRSSGPASLGRVQLLASTGTKSRGTELRTHDYAVMRFVGKHDPMAHNHECVRKSWVTLLVRASSNTKSSNFRNSETPCPTSPTLSWHKHQLRNNFNCSCCMDCLLAFLTSGRSYVILPAATFAASHECETGQRILLSIRKSKWLLECCSGNLMNSTIKKWSMVPK